MAQGYYGHPDTHEFEVQFPYAITSVVYDPMSLDINGDPTPQANAQVSLQCLRDGTRIKIPITRDSMALLPSPQQRALEKALKAEKESHQKTQATVEYMRAQAVKDAKSIQMLETVNGVQKHLVDQKAQEIRDLYEAQESKSREIQVLKAKLAMSQRTAEDWRKHSDKQVAEVRRLESVCNDHWELAQNYKSRAKDAECKWAAEVSEHDNTKNQLREVRVANGKLMDTKHELEKHARGLEALVASLGKGKQRAECRNGQLEDQVMRLLGRVKELETTGSAKERDEYSKALEQKDVQISQITKEWKEWKDRATRAKEMERLEEERDALRKASAMAAACQAVSMPVVTDMSLPTRVKYLETRVTKLEEAEGFPMESYNVPYWQHTQLYMGGKWVIGYKGDSGSYYTAQPWERREWDLAHQPTRWKPMPE